MRELARSGGRRAGLSALVVVGTAVLAAALAVVPAEAQGPQATPQDNAPAGSRADAILGNWLTQDRDGIIQISLGADGRLQGRIAGGDDPARLDTKNPDPTLRQQHVLGMVIMRNLKDDGSGRWDEGTIYDPDSGHTYKCWLQLLGPDRLRIHGFLGVSLLGRSQTWTRYTGSSLQLPAPSH